jgi:RNA-directed DNA polymerase
MQSEKPFSVSKKIVFEAYEDVKRNKGAPGVDNVSLQEFDKDLKNNLYRIWNRLSSGTYFPPPVKQVQIPKEGGKVRLLGVPTVSDRIAQCVVKKYLEPIVEPIFHEDSFGYRPKKSAHDALRVARKRCWSYNWCIDLDIKAFFDNLDWDLALRALRHVCKEDWILLYTERWLKAPIRTAEGVLENRTKGTAQGGVISPLITNIFMHFAFDVWLSRNCPSVRFERYADDALIHCHSKEQAFLVLDKIKRRMKECGLELHPEKTRVIYCKDEDRTELHSESSFDFLGFTFRSRLCRSKSGKIFLNFLPAVSKKALTHMKQEVRSMNLKRQVSGTLAELAQKLNPRIRGWVNYYGVFNRSALSSLWYQVDLHIMKWAKQKYKRFARRNQKVREWLRTIAERDRNLFAHWAVARRVNG